jgi:hypothetical protein
MDTKTLRALTLVSGIALWSGAAAVATALTSTAAHAQRQQTRLTGEEIRATNKDNLFDAVRALRPNWTARRGRGSLSVAEYVKVYVDGMQQGPPAVMRQMNLQEVTEVTYLSAADATTRYGTGHESGAILISTRPVASAANTGRGS